MRSGIIAGIGVTIAAACCVAPTLGNGSDERRGLGNTGCNTAEGTFYSSHLYDAGDRIVIGFQRTEIVLEGISDRLQARNEDAGSEVSNSGGCSADEGVWQLITSDLGPGDDSVRLDAKGLPDNGDIPFEPIPQSIDTSLRGRGGSDVIRGHTGFDDISGGGGADVIKADDGKKDTVKCGKGNDKADVDPKDDVSGCEKKT